MNDMASPSPTEPFSAAPRAPQPPRRINPWLKACLIASLLLMGLCLLAVGLCFYALTTR